MITSLARLPSDDDVVEGLADERRVRRDGVERPLPRARVGDDGRQRLIHLVSDARRHFPQRPHPARLGQLGLRLVQLLLGRGTAR